MEKTQIHGMSRERLIEILDNIHNVKAALIGDMCIDIYWSADMTKSKLSRETPHYPLPVTEERMSAGAGGNAANNMAVLKPGKFSLLGVIGDDWRGMCLSRVLENADISSEYLVTVKNGVTNAYCKPMRRGYLGVEVEDPRIDFESFEPLPSDAESKLIENLKKAVADADVLCVSDQFECGCITPNVRKVINELAKGGLRVVVDSRMRINEYSNAILKPNEIECARALMWESDRLNTKNSDLSQLEDAALLLSEKRECDVCLTVGDRGCLIASKGTTEFVNAFAVEPPVDTVGAGDCFLSAFSLALAAGASYKEAGLIGNLAASISVKKLNTTGSASGNEITARFDEACRKSL